VKEGVEYGVLLTTEALSPCAFTLCATPHLVGYHCSVLLKYLFFLFFIFYFINSGV
jgi:hypothetical protein